MGAFTAGSPVLLTKHSTWNSTQKRNRFISLADQNHALIPQGKEFEKTTHHQMTFRPLKYGEQPTEKY